MIFVLWVLTVLVGSCYCVNRTAEQDDAALELFNNCKCVLYYQCDNENYIRTNGETIIEVRGPDTPERIICQSGSYSGEKICCKERRDDTEITTKKTEINQKDPDEYVTRPPKKKKLKCGQQLPIINIRVLSDEDPTPIDGEFPWIAALFLKKSDGNFEFHCSGSLIHPRVVLTANHCVHRKKAEDIKILVNGKVELQTDNEDDIPLERKISEIINHPDYYSGAVFNDIALLILEEPFNITARTHNINTICLSKKESFEGKRCLVAGWGKSKVKRSKTSMKKVILPTVEFSKCQELLRKTRLGVRFNLHQSFMCAGGEKDRDACLGDGGSPLMCLSSDRSRYFQAGIVSWGIGCGTENVPGVYANVPKFIDWISDNLKQRDIDLT